MLEPGQLVQNFNLPDQHGEKVSLDSYKGKWLVVWWFPRACSELCTIQGRAIVPLVDDIRAAGAEIIGMSFDRSEENRRFGEDEGIEFPLLSDSSMQVGEAWGVKRGENERFADAPRRITYLVNPEGRVVKSYNVEDAEGHAAVMLKDLREFSGQTK